MLLNAASLNACCGIAALLKQHDAGLIEVRAETSVHGQHVCADTIRVAHSTHQPGEEFAMEFNIKLASSTLDLDAIQQAVRAVDPSALVDVDPQGQTLRVAASLDAAELVALISQAGYPLAQHQVVQAPSTCCGGCGG